MASRAPSSALDLSALLWRAPSCILSVCVLRGLQSPPPTLQKGGGSYVSPLSCVSCVPASCVLIITHLLPLTITNLHPFQKSFQTPRGTITERLKITLQNILFHRSWLVEWSSHPHPKCWIPVNLQATTENSSLSTLLDFIIKKKSFPFSISSSFSLPFSPSLASLYFFEQCLRLGVRGTSSVCLPLQD